MLRTFCTETVTSHGELKVLCLGHKVFLERSKETIQDS